jgi:hypothetical protein
MHELPQTYVDGLRNVRARTDLDLNRPDRLEALKQLGKSG